MANNNNELFIYISDCKIYYILEFIKLFLNLMIEMDFENFFY